MFSSSSLVPERLKEFELIHRLSMQSICVLEILQTGILGRMPVFLRLKSFSLNHNPGPFESYDLQFLQNLVHFHLDLYSTFPFNVLLSFLDIDRPLKEPGTMVPWPRESLKFELYNFGQNFEKKILMKMKLTYQK